MKKLLLTLCLLFTIFVLSVAAQEGQISKSLKYKYDKFKDESTLFIGPEYVDIKGPRLEVAMYIGYKGSRPSREGLIIGLAVYSSTRSWRFLSSDNLIILADGKRIEIGKPVTKDSRLARYGGVDESLAYKVSEDELLTMSKASSIEMQIGQTEFKLRDKFLKLLRELAAALPPSE